MYKIKYGISGMEKFISDEKYDDLSSTDQYFYTKVIPRQCGAHERDSELNIKYEESQQNLNKVVKQDYS